MSGKPLAHGHALCKRCNQRPAIYCYHGAYAVDTDHDLCSACTESLQDSMRVRERRRIGALKAMERKFGKVIA